VKSAFAIDDTEPFERGRERELFLRSGIRIVMPGHCDDWVYYPRLKLLIITDAKFGFVEVTPAPLNLQLRSYAVMGSQEWDVDTCIVAIAQPRAYMIEGAERLTIARYDRADLVLAKRQILDWEKQWLAKDAKRRASEDACRYCKAKVTCGTYTARIVELAAGDLAGIADLPAEAVVALFEAMRLANKEDFQETVKAEARIRVAEGRLPGHKLKPNSPRRSIIDQVQAAKILRDHLNFEDEEIAAASKVTLGEVSAYVERVQPNTCPGCQAALTPEMKRCRECGADLEGDNQRQIPVIVSRTDNEFVLSEPGRRSRRAR
jgi:hypothetical protein